MNFKSCIYVGAKDDLLSCPSQLRKKPISHSDILQKPKDVGLKISKIIKSHYKSGHNLLLASNDPDTIGVFLVMFYLMDIENLSYEDARAEILER
jgi:hypothetical protein